eukprot:1445142-Rhodomonas_salina.3
MFSFKCRLHHRDNTAIERWCSITLRPFEKRTAGPANRNSSLRNQDFCWVDRVACLVPRVGIPTPGTRGRPCE